MSYIRTDELLTLTPAAAAPERQPTELVVVGVFRDPTRDSPAVAALDGLVGGAFSRARDRGDFGGRPDDFALFHPVNPGRRDSDGSHESETSASEDSDGPRRVLFLGLGKEDDSDRETVREFAGRAVRRAEALRVTELHLVVPVIGQDPDGSAEGASAGDAAFESARAGAEALHLAAFDFRELKTRTDDDDPPAPLVQDARISVDGGASLARDRLKEALRIGSAFGAGENLARILQFRPGNVATPTHLAGVATEMADALGLELTVLGPDEMKTEGMGALLSVAAGSDEEPRLIVLEHRGGQEGDAPLAMVGKGLTFDTGGISLKPPSGMEDMKFDMSGGAAVLGAMMAIGLLRPAANVVGVVPSSENMVNGRATKPGDVIRTRAGKTVEVINTDAEGRLILADALSYTSDRFRPAAMVDCATLTGACVIALGHHAAALLGSDESLIDELRGAGDRSGERCWPLPLWKEYRKQLDSPVADMKNVGGRPAGTVTAAHFLSEFVGDTPWAHLDIAGTAYGEPRAAYQRKGGFGFPTRLLLEWIRTRSG